MRRSAHADAATVSQAAMPALLRSDFRTEKRSDLYVGVAVIPRKRNLEQERVNQQKFVSLMRSFRRFVGLFLV